MSGIISPIVFYIDEEIVYLITGGGSGIGRALAFALAKRNKQVFIVGRREKLLQETASLYTNIHYLCADVSTPQGRELIKASLSATPQIDGLINNAGTLEPTLLLKDMSFAEWHQALNTNIDAALFLPQLLYDKLSGGRVLNVGSAAAYFPIKGWGAYCVSKAALAMLTRCWQIECDSLAFASVMPGIIDTHMQAIARNGINLDPEQVNFYRRLKDHNRLISPETVAEFFIWLLLDIDNETYVSKEWDIYDTTHHSAWLKPPHQVLHWEF
ncbi:TPA: SDR family NAD(P)-dependent oxidoreductase [Legionella pneumophila]|uniref:SDR family NAD(P)-dependent oxidoreductase n=1 Tax=Legionella pneumophila TaxID=446 RepID=A0AAN5Q5E1_LEGPN|nr:SDR family NAD(P)-dependent oxidoreductase [Legionella pneumophila]TIH04913.1 KR domain-containing protein [Legionella pneumophila]HAT2123057.1 SDR family NAD(P)-dependent oxidoreductase [Legionella pneumophila]HAT3857412.1 SDR family NAD(P)-dependent oxidoreductase [Legionella pneumophila]HAT3866918.1 SDR family NAD(P)-dependent oxidoreductase [Legionella pneumophila]HAT3877793.1 SDR family NAD(P)-dependent oxidoreductase [Legionella pneumophila]